MKRQVAANQAAVPGLGEGCGKGLVLRSAAPFITWLDCARFCTGKDFLFTCTASTSANAQSRKQAERTPYYEQFSFIEMSRGRNWAYTE